MHKLKCVLSGSVLLLSALLYPAVTARAERVLQGEVCLQRVQQLTSDINWYKSLDKAQDSAKEEGKLIVWIHMVGKMDGAT